jgi:hypothetical protein
LPSYTSRLSLVQPIPSDAVEELYQSIAANASSLDGSVTITEGTVSARPTSGSYVGQTYYATDTGLWYFWTGSAWEGILLGATTTVAQAYRNAAYSLPSGSYQEVPIDTIAFDPGGNMDVTTGHRYNVPSTGYYFVSVGAQFDPSGTGGTNEGAIAAAVSKNGSLSGALPSQQLNNVLAGYNYTATASGLISCNAGDYLQLAAFMQLGGAGALNVGAGANWLSVYRVA